MKTRKEALRYGLSFPDTYQDAPFHDENWQLVRYRENQKVFLWTYEKDGHINLNVKVDPDKAFFWRDRYGSVIPGYHQNKDHWNTVILDGSIPDRDIKAMIAESYDLIADSPSKRIYDAVKKIPYGKVDLSLYRWDDTRIAADEMPLWGAAASRQGAKAPHKP